MGQKDNVKEVKMKALCILLFPLSLSASTNWIMSDHQFTNPTAYSDSVYYRAYSDDYTTNEIRYIIQVYSGYQLNPVLAFMTIYKEGRPKNSWHFGCNSHIEIPRGSIKHKDFWAQVRMSAETYRIWFDHAKDNNFTVYLHERNGWKKVSNRATFALYMYTPRYHELIYGLDTGNIYVPAIWKRVTKKLESNK